MEPGQLARVAVTLTQVIKNTTDQTPGDVIKEILIALPELTVEDIILYLTTMANEKGIIFKDVEDLIRQIQFLAKTAKSDLDTNSLWQNIAQGLYYVGHLIKGFLPPKWRTVITVVLDAYEELKGK